MARGKVQTKNKKISSTKKSGTKSSDRRVSFGKTNIESKSEDESDSQIGTNDSAEPVKVVKKSVGRPRKDANTKVSASTEKKSVGRPKNRAHRSESSSSKNLNGESSVDRSKRGSKENRSKRSKSTSQQLDSDGGESSSKKLSEDEDNYEVEDIIDFKIEDDIKYFLIRWKGYDSNVDSWEKRRSLNCPELIAKFYDKHPEARTSNTKRKRNYDSDYEVSSSDSNCDLATIKTAAVKNGKTSTRVRQYSTSDEESESESEVDPTDSEPKVVVKKSVGRPKNVVKISSSTEKKVIGRPRKHDISDDEDQYEVEDIIDWGIEDNIKYFLVRWKGYDSSVDSWEKHRSLNCPELIAEYYKKHPEARVSTTSYKKTKTHHTVDGSYSDSDSGSNADSDYGPTYYEQLRMQPIGSVKKRGKKSICKRTSGRQTSVKSTYKTNVHSTSDEDSESEPSTEPEVEENSQDGTEEKKSVGRPRKHAVANISSSTKKKSAGRPKKHGHLNEVSKETTENSSVDRSEVDDKEGSSQEEQGEDGRSDSDTNKSIENSILS